MALHKVVVDLVAKGDQAAKEFKKTADAVDRVAGSSTKAQSAIQGVTGFLRNNKVALGAVATAFALEATVIQQSVSAYTNYASKVREVQRVSGATAEEASGLTYAFEKLGIGATKGAGAVFQLEKRVGTGKDGLDKFGVAIQRNADGGVNLVGTLGNIADAYQRSGDQSRKAAILAAAFGKQGKDLIPVLAKGREGIRALFDEAGRTNHILDQGDLDRAKQFTLATRELGLTFDGLKIKLGNAFTPMVTKLTEATTATVQLGDAVGIFDALSAAAGAWADSIAAPIGLMKAFTDELGVTTTSVDTFSIASKELNDDQRAYAALVAQGNEKTAEGAALKKRIAELNGVLGTTQEKLAETFKTAEQKAQDEARALNDLKGALFGLDGASHSVADAQLNEADAKERLLAAQDNLNKIKLEGQSQDETQEQFARRIAAAERDVERATYGVADAHGAVAKAAIDALTSQQAFDSAAKDPTARAALIAQLQDARLKFGDATGAIGEAITKLQAYDQTNPKDKTIRVDNSQALGAIGEVVDYMSNLHDKALNINVHAATVISDQQRTLLHELGVPGFARGGTIPSNSLAIVGENGPELVRTGAQPSNVTPNNQLGGIGGSTVTYQITVSTPAVTADTGRVLVEHIRAYERNSGSRWRQN